MINEINVVHIEPERENAFVRWILGFAHPVEPFGDYFDRLGSSVAASAPVCYATCG